MDPAKRSETVNAGIKAQRLIIEECKKNNDALGVKRAEKKIKEYEKELERLGKL